eukprot:scaffold1352_cov136-Skeletonema_menzelii.AAC.10
MRPHLGRPPDKIQQPNLAQLAIWQSEATRTLPGAKRREGNIFGSNKSQSYPLRYTYIADLMRPLLDCHEHSICRPNRIAHWRHRMSSLYWPFIIVGRSGGGETLMLKR